MNKALITALICSALGTSLYAQQDDSNHYSEAEYSAPIPVEVTVGHQSSLHQTLISKTFGQKQQFGFFGLLNYEVDYLLETPDNFFTQSFLSFNINRFFSIGAGANLKSFGGFKPVVAGAFNLYYKGFGVVIQPSIELDKEGVSELFALFEWFPSKHRNINPYVNLQGNTSINTKGGDHSFSYLYLKAGIQFKNLRIGPALNLQKIGSGNYAQNIVNTGGFLSILLY